MNNQGETMVPWLGRIFVRPNRSQAQQHSATVANRDHFDEQL